MIKNNCLILACHGDLAATRALWNIRSRTMRKALNLAVGRACAEVSEDTPTIYLRDGLGGLRAEVRWREGEEPMVRRTPR